MEQGKEEQMPERDDNIVITNLRLNQLQGYLICHTTLMALNIEQLRETQIPEMLEFWRKMFKLIKPQLSEDHILMLREQIKKMSGMNDVDISGSIDDIMQKYDGI